MVSPHKLSGLWTESVLVSSCLLSSFCWVPLRLKKNFFSLLPPPPKKRSRKSHLSDFSKAFPKSDAPTSFHAKGEKNTELTLSSEGEENQGCQLGLFINFRPNLVFRNVRFFKGKNWGVIRISEHCLFHCLSTLRTWQPWEKQKGNRDKMLEEREFRLMDQTGDHRSANCISITLNPPVARRRLEVEVKAQKKSIKVYFVL